MNFPFFKIPRNHAKMNVTKIFSYLVSSKLITYYTTIYFLQFTNYKQTDRANMYDHLCKDGSVEVAL